MVITSPGHQNA